MSELDTTLAGKSLSDYTNTQLRLALGAVLYTNTAEMWQKYLNQQGYTGSVSDMLQRYYVDRNVPKQFRNYISAGIYLNANTSDPNFASVSALLHFDGANGSTTFTDVKGNTWTPVDNAQISTTQSRFGGSSLYLDGSLDELSCSSNTVATSTILTLEAWVYITEDPPASPGWGYPIFGQGAAQASGEQVLAIRPDRSVSLSRGTGVGPLLSCQTAAAAVPINQWVHVAATMNGTVAKVFINGIESASAADSTGWLDTGRAFRIGRIVVVNYESFQGYFKGWMDDVRITKGVARYSGNFVPPSYPFPDA